MELLKFITCGSVDDGKSTLIGHMLYDAKLLFADQENALELDSKVGSRGGKIDYSLLLDGLMAEREQGITIDVAYRYFTTNRRSFIVADTPGHEEYTRNMAVGASFADLAIILVDASQGVLTQTRRHARICSMVGIRHFVFAVNKMDLINYDRNAFKKIEKDIKILLAEFDYDSLVMIPVSATEGDNVNKPSENMKWYTGEHLEEIDVTADDRESGFTMPVQRVCRPNHTFRGFSGQVESGALKVGDEIEIYPSHEKANVKALIVAGSEKNACEKGQPVTVQLDREIDVSRGCVIAKDAALTVGNVFRANLLWMDDDPLIPGKNYMLKLGTRKLPAIVLNIKYKIDVNTGAQVTAERIHKNEIAQCDISVSDKVVFDEFEQNPGLGSFILIDRINHMTSACGVVLHKLDRGENLSEQKTQVSVSEREAIKGQKSITVWFSGLSASGKSEIAAALERKLFMQGKHTMVLDGQNMRLSLNKNLGFKETDRIEGIRRVAEVSKLFNDAGVIVIDAFISPYKRDRLAARETIGWEKYVEVYVSTPIEECEKRDEKGLYKKARAGEIQNFTGVNAPYEKPTGYDVEVDVSKMSIEECVDAIYEVIKERI